MTKTIRLDAEAEEEIVHAIERYNAERAGLGAEFLDELRDSIETLSIPGPECGSWSATSTRDPTQAALAIPLRHRVRRERCCSARHLRHARPSTPELLAPPAVNLAPTRDPHTVQTASTLLPSGSIRNAA